MQRTNYRIIMIGIALAAFACAVTVAGRAVAAPQDSGASGYHLAKKIKLGGQGGWDYLTVDEATHRLFISRGTHVMVVDTADGKIISDIPGMHRVHGIALAPEFNKGFVSDGEPGTVTVFDYKTLKVLDTLKTDRDCDAIIYDPSSKRVFTMNGDANTSTAIDAATGKVIGTFPLGGGPEFAAADGKGHVFANLEDKSAMVKINPQTLKVEQTWPLAPCQSPSGLAIDAEHERLVVGCHNGLMAFVDGTTGKVVGNVPIGQGVDANRFDPDTGYAFASCGDGTITVAHEESPDHFIPAGKIETMRGARTMTLDMSDHTIYTVTAEYGPAPPATAANQRARPPMLPDSFTLLVFTR